MTNLSDSSVFFTFTVKGQPYCMASAGVEEVIPDLPLYTAAAGQDAPCLVGYLSYRNAQIAVADMGLLLGGEPCRRCLSTRIMVVDVSSLLAPGQESRRWIGLRAENLLDYLEVQPGWFDQPEYLPPAEIGALGQYTLCIKGVDYQCVDPRHYLAAL
jgi:chemotaxis-related protein WspB